MLHHHAIEATAAESLQCPSCGLPATITDRFTLHGSPGPVEHVRLVCVRRSLVYATDRVAARSTTRVSWCRRDAHTRTRERVRSR